VEHFVTLERAIACPQASAAVAAETAAQVLTSAGYRRGLGFGPTASYVRTYRPLWLVVVARVGAVFTLGLTLLLLRYHKKDHCNVVIEDGPYGVVALVSGRVPATLPTALEAASGQYVQPLEPDGSYQEPPPMLLTPPAGQENSPSHTPQAILRPATPVPPMNQAPGSPVGEQLASGADGGYAASPRLLSDPYPMPQHEPAPGGVPGWARLPERMPGSAPSSAEVVPPAGPVRPPSRLAPPVPPDLERPQPQPSAQGGPSSSPSSAPAEDDPFSSTSGRVPWVGGGRQGSLSSQPGALLPSPGLPSPAGPAPVSPVSLPPVFPQAAPVPEPLSPFPPAGGRPPVPGGPPSVPGGPGGPGDAPQPGRVATAVSDAAPVLRVDTGEVLELGPFCLLGREPVARGGDPEARLVRFEDPKLSVSKTHLAYGVDARGIWVMDRNSTNGTTIIDPSGRRTPCAPGSRQYVIPGFQIQIGQRRILVEAPGAGSG
jgi:hypothetical protein